MKYLAKFGFYFCSVATGAQLANHNYGLALANVAGIAYFYYIDELYSKRS